MESETSSQALLLESYGPQSRQLRLLLMELYSPWWLQHF
jgi:hypothetical protein